MSDKLEKQFGTRKVEKLTEEIDELDNWSVEDWHFEGGMYEEIQVSVEVRYSPPLTYRVTDEDGNKKTAKEVVEELEGDYERGVPYGVVIERFIQLGFSDRVLDTLKAKGEVYEPEEGHFRTT